MKYQIHKDKKRRIKFVKCNLKHYLLKSLLLETIKNKKTLVCNFLFFKHFIIMQKLQNLKLYSYIVKIQNRCIFTGHPRAISRYYRMSRIVLRDFASKGKIIGLAKSSW